MMTAWVTGSEEVVPTHAPTLPQELPRLLNLHHFASHDFCWRVGDAWLGLVAARAGPGRVEDSGDDRRAFHGKNDRGRSDGR